jgi:hypothetical protein
MSPANYAVSFSQNHLIRSGFRLACLGAVVSRSARSRSVLVGWSWLEFGELESLWQPNPPRWREVIPNDRGCSLRASVREGRK